MSDRAGGDLWYVLNHTAWGRHVHAIGDDPEAAMLSGIKVDRTLISVYAVAGLICGFAAWVAIGRVGSVSPIAFETVNLGLHHRRGDRRNLVVRRARVDRRVGAGGHHRGCVHHRPVGSAGVDDYWQMFAAGCLVIIAVALDQWLRRASQVTNAAKPILSARGLMKRYGTVVAMNGCRFRPVSGRNPVASSATTVPANPP